jgi:hypothetical protein
MLFDEPKRKITRTVQINNHMRLTRDIATCMYYTGLDPFTKKRVYVAQHLKDRKLQRALLHFFKPENYLEVRKALEIAARKDLIGAGCDALIPAQPPREARRSQIEEAGKAIRGDHVHTISPPTRTKGSRPGRKLARRQHKAGRRGEPD